MKKTFKSKLNTTTDKSDKDIFGEDLHYALIDFRNTYDVTIDDCQTFIMGWNAAIDCIENKYKS